MQDGTGASKAKRRVGAEDAREEAQAMERKAGAEWAFSSNDLNNDDEAFDDPEKLEKPRATMEQSDNQQQK